MLWRNILVLCLVLYSWPTFAQDNVYLQQLVQQARQLHLAQRTEWLNLLHVKPYPFWPGSRSLADDAAFFNSPDGKTNPAAELEATLSIFFSDLPETDKHQNPQCSFMARYEWLKQELKFDPQRLPEQTCKRFNEWRDALNPYGVTLVFPAAYLNNPSSMYGHTLLRIDAKDQDENTRLLAYAIGYAANTSESNGLTFAIKGLMGGYPGVYSIDPYYLKVREYNDIENRDVWEYPLTLTPVEINRLLKHVWELGPIRFDYYFFDENCAYHLLALLEVARPGLELTDRFRWWAIPSDTVRAVVDQPGLTREAIFRPSKRTVINQRITQLNSTQLKLAKAMATGNLPSDNPQLQQVAKQQQAQLFELGYDYLSYLQARKNAPPEASKLSRELLLARSHLDVADMTPKIVPPDTRPDQGHNTGRVGIAWGNMDQQHYQEINARPAYHDQLDPEGGYTRGAQIQFGNFAFRHYEYSGGLRLEEFMPIDIYSLVPNNEYFQSVSWKINAGWMRMRLPNNNESLVARIRGGVGRSWETSAATDAAIIYAFADGTLEENASYSHHYALGMGPAIGVLGNIHSNWRLNAYARVQRFGLGDVHTEAELTLAQRYSIGAQDAVRLTLARKQEFDLWWTEAQINWQHYF